MRRVLAVAFGALMILGAAGTANAQGGRSLGDQVVMTGRVVVARGERSKNIVVFHGPVTVDGDVRGSVVVFDGSLRLSGTVRDSAVVFNGPVSLQSGARVGADLVSRRRPSVASGAVVEGRIRRVNPLFTGLGFRLAVRYGVWLAFTISVLILGALMLLLAPRGMEAVAEAARYSLGASIGWGVLLFVGLPILAFIVLATVVGSPLGLALLLALWFLYIVGYTAAVWAIGRMLVRPPGRRFLAFLAGWGILRAVALVPFLAGIAWTLATIFGLGALLVAIWRARTPAPAAPPAAVAVPAA